MPEVSAGVEDISPTLEKADVLVLRLVTAAALRIRVAT